MTNQFPKSVMWLRRIFYFAAAVLFLLLLANIVLNLILEKKLKRSLNDIHSNLRIEYSSAHATIFGLSCVVEDLKVIYRPDTSTTNEHVIRCEEVRLEGINIFKWWFGNEIAVQKLVLTKGTISLDDYLLAHRDTIHDASSSGTPVKHMSIHSVEIKEVTMVVHAGSINTLQWNGNIHIHGLASGNDKDLFSTNTISPESFECTINDLDYRIAESFLHIHVKKLTMDSEANHAAIDSITCIPELGKFEYARKLGYQSDHVSVHVEKAELKGMDVMSLLKGDIIASEIIFGNTTINVFRDRRIKRKMDIKKLPDQLLHELTNDVRIDKLIIPEAFLSYEEFPANGVDSSGIMRFEKVNVVAQHVFNHPVNDSDFIDLKTDALLMGSGILKSTTHIPLVPGKKYFVKGEIKNMDLTTLNASTVNLSMIHVESGKLNSLSFYYYMSHEKATGEIVGNYTNLKIEKLKLDSKKNLKRASFETFVQKTFIIPLNKDQSVPVNKRTGKIDCERDSTRFFTAYITKALLTGVKNSFALGFLLPE